MNYIYDIVLNFNKDYFEFFQWRKSDKIINVKKIPVFRVSDEDINILKYNIVKVNTEFLNKIFDLTLFYNRNENFKYMCLISNGNESIGLMFDKLGNLIKKSSMIFDEEEEVNEEVNELEILKIEYVENVFRKIDYISRIDKERKEYLYKFINNLDVKDNANILKYIYYDYFEKEEEDPVVIKKLILNELDNYVSDNSKLYELVRFLKKIKNLSC